MILNVRNKGLVVLTGCGHAGVVNTLKHARDLDRVSNIHAVIGGFHLTGPVLNRSSGQPFKPEGIQSEYHRARALHRLARDAFNRARIPGCLCAQ